MAKEISLFRRQKNLIKKLVYYANQKFDEIAILTALGKVAFDQQTIITGDDEIIMEAVRRSTPELSGANQEEISAYLRDLDPDQIDGFANNVKGIAHELLYEDFINEGDFGLKAEIFDATNHPDSDIILTDDAGESWEIQLKATDSEAVVRDWLENHPDGDILVTKELAEKLDLDSTGISNEELTADVDEVTDKLIHNPTLLDHLPVLSVASIGRIIVALWQRYRKGEITREQFYSMATRASGLKAAKVAAIIVLLKIPIINVATGAYLVTQLILAVHSAYSQKGEFIS